jgi:hypothetical protein
MLPPSDCRDLAAELQEGGKARENWSAIEKGLIERALERVRVSTFNP